jgi:hypothetical protein
MSECRNDDITIFFDRVTSDSDQSTASIFITYEKSLSP